MSSDFISVKHNAVEENYAFSRNPYQTIT